MTIKRTGGGIFDPTERYIYFCAGQYENIGLCLPFNKHVLFAVNEVNGAAEAHYSRVIELGAQVFLDSGVYGLASEHARAHGMTHNDALGVHPTKLDGWDVHLAKYIRLVRQWEDKLWGYVELDLGGREVKRQTRAMLEAEGLRPVPVYHPLMDGWDYFDELAEQYDRICLGNIVAARPSVRIRLLATLHERKQKYPNLFIHALGLTPSPALLMYPMDSCDSSSWLSAARWGRAGERAMGQHIGYYPPELVYTVGDREQWLDCQKIGAYLSAFESINWDQYVNLMGELQ